MLFPVWHAKHTNAIDAIRTARCLLWRGSITSIFFFATFRLHCFLEYYTLDKKEILNCICALISHFWPLLAPFRAVCIFCQKGHECFHLSSLLPQYFLVYELSCSAMHISTSWQRRHCSGVSRLHNRRLVADHNTSYFNSLNEWTHYSKFVSNCNWNWSTYDQCVNSVQSKLLWSYSLQGTCEVLHISIKSHPRQMHFRYAIFFISVCSLHADIDKKD